MTAPEVWLLPAGQVCIRIGEDSYWVIEPEGRDHSIRELPYAAIRLVPESAEAVRAATRDGAQ